MRKSKAIKYYTNSNHNKIYDKLKSKIARYKEYTTTCNLIKTFLNIHILVQENVRSTVDENENLKIILKEKTDMQEIQQKEV